MTHSKLWSFASQSKIKRMSTSLSILLLMGIYVVAFHIEQSSTVQAQGQSNDTTTTTPMKGTQANATSANTIKPVDGYVGPPTGPLNAVRHVFEDPTLIVYHFCKPNDKTMMVYQLYDSRSPNTTLIGVEYMVDSKTYQALPEREKPNWHYHEEEFSSDTANPKFQLLNYQQQKE